MTTPTLRTAPNPNAQLSARVAPQTQLVPLAFEEQCKTFFATNMKRLINLAGSQEEARTIMLAAMNAVSKSTFLMDAVGKDFSGFARCIMTSCELRLYPGAMQECAYVPMKNNKTGNHEFQFWLMYQGLSKLMYQSGLVRAISCEVVYEADEFKFELGTNKFLRHVPSLIGDSEDRGQRVCAYACIETAHGVYIEIVPIRKIESIRAKSPSVRAKVFSAWDEADPEVYDIMCKKTALKQAGKWVPKSYRTMRAIEMDDEPFEKKPEVDFFGGKDLGVMIDAPVSSEVKKEPTATDKESSATT